MGPVKKDPRPGAQHAREFYDKWEFVQKAVCLHAAGVGWKGARIGVLLAQSDQIDWRGELEEDALRELLRDWFIDGQTILTFSSEAPIRLVPRGTADSYDVVVETVGTSPSGEEGLTLLWPACSNFEAVEQLSELARGGNTAALRLMGQVLGYAYSSLGLPRWALEPKTAAEASAQAVQYDLHWYRLFVDGWREDFALSLCRKLRERWRGQQAGLSDVFIEWNREWFPSQQFSGWEAVYETFDRCGLTLVNFGKEYPAQLREIVELRVLPRSALASWKELGL